MALLLELALTAMAGLLAVPVLLLAVEIFSAALRSRKARPDTQTGEGEPPAVAVLVPAHNEAKVIGETLKALRRQLSAGHRLVVVADNCSDDTAAIAERYGAEVVVRNEPDKRGKGYALDAGIRRLEAAPPHIVIVVDADCRVHDGAIRALAGSVHHSGAPQQALYLMRPHGRAGLGQRVSAFAFAVKNHVRLLGLTRLGIPSHLTGTGMAFPWRVIRDAQLASGNLVEDMQLGVDLVRNGTPADFCPDAVVTSSFPLGDEPVLKQRTRWEHGHLRTIFSEAPGLAWQCLRRGDWRGVVFALDLAIPPLTLLAGLLAFGLLIAAAAALSGVGELAFTLVLGLAGVFTASLFAAWSVFGREVLPLLALTAVPGYVASKLAVYFRFRPGRGQEWVRTRRD